VYLYLVQHGEARKEEEGPERRLTDKGVSDVGKVAAYAGKMNLNAAEIFHSPKARAQQTALILAEQLEPKRGRSLSENLLPMDDPALWAARLARMNENIMLVGHLPYLARLAGLLLCGDKEKTPVDFKMGGIVCLRRFDDGRWAIEWMNVPEMVGQ
jgi:phosphohistidine phosphatase